jgi:surfactin family lipopeptide synthetase A
LFHQHQQGRPLSLPRKTDAFKVWAEQLSVYANSTAFLKEKAYWKKTLHADVPRITPDFPEGSNLIKDRAFKKTVLTAEDTERLLTNVRSAFNTEINDILLSALALSLRQSFGIEQARIAMEGHGREHVLNDVNVSRTVGYFTSIYPLTITAAGDDLRATILRNKKRAHEVPNKGIGYGILKYLTAKENKQDVDLHEEPQIAFNYFGQFDEDIARLPFGFATEDTGQLQNANEQREYELYITGMTEGGQFSLSVDYSAERFSEDTIATLLENYNAALRSVIEHCCAQVAE